MTVSFGGGSASNALIKLELDDKMNVDSSGEEISSFAPGDNIYFRLHHDTTVQLARMASTDGEVEAQGSGSRTITEELLWVYLDDEHELGYVPNNSGITSSHYGSEPSDIKKSGTKKMVISGGELPALSLVTYSANFSLYRLIAPDVDLAEDESWPVRIVAYMEDV